MEDFTDWIWVWSSWKTRVNQQNKIMNMTVSEMDIKRKMAADSKTKERKLDTHMACIVGIGQRSFILTKLLNLSTCSGIGDNRSYLS